MDRELPKEIIVNRRRKKWITAIAALIFLIIIAWILKQLGTRSIDWTRIKYSVAEYGDVEATLNASGTIIPETEQAITSPGSTILRRVLLSPGDYAKKGQTILELDKEDLQTEQLQTQKELELLEHKRSQTALDLEQKLAEMKASEEVKQLQTGFADDQYMRIKRLNEIGATSGEDLQRAFIAAEIAKRELSVLNLQIVNQRASMEVELQAIDLQIHIQEEKLENIDHRLALSNAPAPLDGIVTWVNDSIGFPVREGDVVARVADLSRYRLQGEISSVNASQLAVGQVVIIRIGEKIIRGKIASISPTVQNGITPFNVQLNDPSDEALRPNLRTDVYVVTAKVDNIIRVANGPFYDGFYDQTIFVIKGDRAGACKVDIGAANFDWVELRGPISPGDTVIVSDTKKYREARILSIKNRKNENPQNK